jgi:hypothetical protein
LRQLNILSLNSVIPVFPAGRIFAATGRMKRVPALFLLLANSAARENIYEESEFNYS